MNPLWGFGGDFHGTVPHLSRRFPIAELQAPVISCLLFYINVSQVEAFERGLSRLLTEAREAPGCRWAYAFKGEDITPHYMVLSGWEDVARMQAWEESPRHVRITQVAEEEWFLQPIIMRRYQALG